MASVYWYRYSPRYYTIYTCPDSNCPYYQAPEATVQALKWIPTKKGLVLTDPHYHYHQIDQVREIMDSQWCQETKHPGTKERMLYSKVSYLNESYQEVNTPEENKEWRKQVRTATPKIKPRPTPDIQPEDLHIT